MSEQQSEVQARPKKESELVSWIKAFAFAFGILLLLRLLGFAFRQINGPSMYPTLEDGDRVIISSFNYTPKQGDIVTFTKEYRGQKKSFVKRVIAVEGDEISMDFEAGQVFVNGGEVTPELAGEPVSIKGDYNYPMTVPEGHIFVMGDNRNNSEDSRSDEVGPIALEEIDGKLIFRLFPLRKLGTLSQLSSE